jgi:hypothetical protein
MTETTNQETPNLNGAAPEIVAKLGAAKSPVDGRELLRTDAGSVQGTVVTMDRSGAETVTADRISMNQSGTRTLDAKSAQLDNSGVVLLKSEKASVYKSSIGLVGANELRLSKSKALIVASGETVSDGNVSAGLHIGPVSGDIKVMIDGKRLVLLGAAIALGFRLFGVLAGRFKRSESEG